MNTLSRITGSMLGLAIGDALGFPIEFQKHEEIVETFGPEGVQDYLHYKNFPLGTYSDDTQMTIAVAQALIEASPQLDEIMENVRREFIIWANSPDNNRAPGLTCVAGVKDMEEGTHWKNSGDSRSKGCGAAMRSAPIGLLFHANPMFLKEVAHWVSACTHSHETGITSGIATAYLTSLALQAEDPATYIDKTIKLCNHSREISDKLTQVNQVLHLPPAEAIPLLGEGWIGEEAVAIALYAFLRSPENFEKTIIVSINHSGDSDSTGCIAGAISGAYNGVDAIPERWNRAIENRELLNSLARQLHQKGDTTQ